jgi:pantetheine-phosphate adenylyltransferase
MTTVLYPGSFDPVTFGHLDVIERAAGLFDRVVVAIGVHHAKTSLFNDAERIEMLRTAIDPIAARTGCAIVVETFDGLVVEAARTAGARAIVRGLRNSSDFDYETQMAGMNAVLAPEVEVVYLAATPSVRHIASSLVRQVAALGGPLDAFVPPHVAEKLRSHFAR